jgi:hypothetical protein
MVTPPRHHPPTSVTRAGHADTLFHARSTHMRTRDDSSPSKGEVTRERDGRAYGKRGEVRDLVGMD